MLPSAVPLQSSRIAVLSWVSASGNNTSRSTCPAASATLTLAKSVFLCSRVCGSRCACVRLEPDTCLRFGHWRRLQSLLRTLPSLLVCLCVPQLQQLLSTGFGLGAKSLGFLLFSLVHLHLRLGRLLLGLLRTCIGLCTQLLLTLLCLRFCLRMLLLMRFHCPHPGLWL